MRSWSARMLDFGLEFSKLLLFLEWATISLLLPKICCWCKSSWIVVCSFMGWDHTLCKYLQMQMDWLLIHTFWSGRRRKAGHQQQPWACRSFCRRFSTQILLPQERRAGRSLGRRFGIQLLLPQLDEYPPTGIKCKVLSWILESAQDGVTLS